MRTPAVQPRILSKKNIFHLRINRGTQERKHSFVKKFLSSLINGGTSQIMQMRTAAVQPPIYAKNHEKLYYINIYIGVDKVSQILRVYSRLWGG